MVQEGSGASQERWEPGRLAVGVAYAESPMPPSDADDASRSIIALKPKAKPHGGPGTKSGA